MRVVKVEESEIASWTRTLRQRQRIVAVQEKDGHFVFDDLKSAEDLRLDHDVTLQPPLRFFLPEKEQLLSFSRGGGYRAPESDDKPFVLLGVHPYDVAAIAQMDAVFSSGVEDPHYMRRRQLATIVACDVETPSKNVFAGCMGTAVVRDGYDLLLTRVGRHYIAESLTAKGDALIALFGEAVEEPTPWDLQRREAVWQRNRQGLRQHELDCPPEMLPRLMALSYDDKIWQEKSQTCFSCGSCNLVCPTCYCFDVEEDVDWDLGSGQRVRLCDGCLLEEFAKVAGGHQFRSRSERYRHRFYRKASYMPQRFGFVACVGCGRCIDACVPGIANPVEVYNLLLERHPEALEPATAPVAVGAAVATAPAPAVATASRMVSPTAAITLEPLAAEQLLRQGAARPTDEFAVTDPYVPEQATIVEKKRVTQLETYYKLRLESGRKLGHKSGQFVQISLMGIGEAPISISSGPTEAPTFEMVVRRVGNVTEALEAMNPGDTVGVRGPYGTAFPISDLTGKNILVVAGGIGLVPVRSAIQEVLSHAADFGRLTIAYGMREPRERLFGDEIAKWQKLPGVQVLESVDRVEGGPWHGQVGPVTTLLPLCGIVPSRTAALVCGPPVMYRYVLADLISMGMKPEDIYVSLERRMKCGIGKCGHCQINGVYVCQDGPVFTYAQVKDLPEALS